jgi:hypothetical protein
VSRREPDVEISPSVKADEIRFECKPEVRVTAHSTHPARAETRSERDNLPDEVEPGVTYRDIAVRWSASVTLEEPE